jgi:hypothetical protein
MARGEERIDEGGRQMEAGLYERLADLEFEVAGYRLERRDREVSSGFVRSTTTIALQSSAGAIAGRGEDVTYDAQDHDDYPDGLDLSGRTTLAEFSARLDEIAARPSWETTPQRGAAALGAGLFARRPQREMSYQHRRWAFESAALDLALRENGLSLGSALGLTYRPVRFVVSTRLDIRPWLALYPSLEFKLDPTPEWDDELIGQIAATGAVRVVDFKSFYRGTPVDVEPDPELYARIIRWFPEAIVEDAAVKVDTCEALGGSLERLSWDAPIHSWEDVEIMARVTALDVPRYLNIKPSRFGTLRALLDCVERALGRGIVLYGGGQFELGVGRSQIQALASLFYADAPNDVAPLGYNEPEARAGLPVSPLAPPERPVGFSFD